MTRPKPLPRPSRLLTIATAVLCQAGASREAALAFLADMARAGQRQLVHDDPDGLAWLYQIEQQARARLRRTEDT